VSAPDVVDARSVPSATEACSAGAQGACESMGSIDVMGVSRGMRSTCRVLAVAAKREGMSTQSI